MMQVQVAKNASEANRILEELDRIGARIKDVKIGITGNEYITTAILILYEVSQ